ncbi:flavin reductase family protein [Hydrogenophaga sp. BPS33]|uniref:flavin reductase family protein n=1 Tax=Hydrogenophaga sp. BPS33 TaxID=2651974 RepID=UPI00131FA449|nr:flavin reductase family protein [Hydrogenophaga sp. BPS33]QHE84667.1 flavin reductase family protein [Hydrogenophaga sp. BPS33]
MYFDIDKLDQKLSYKLLASSIVPRPIAWVVTCDDSGRPNAAPYSFFNFFSGFPPVICIGMGLQRGEPKDSYANIKASREFVVNLVPSDLAEEMNTTAVPFPRTVNELEVAGLATTSSTKVRPPRIERSPVALECRLNQVIPVDTTGVILVAHVVAVHIKDEAVVNAEKCYLDPSKLDLLGRMESPGWYTHTRERFKMKQLGVEEWERKEKEG